jgi:hypothetical protein
MAPADPGVASRHVRAWLFLTATLGLHVIDEALTGFLDFYNPLVDGIRTQVSWFPMPTFTFRAWLAGLILLVVVLASLAPVVRRGGRVVRFLSWMLGVIMLTNGIGHLGGSVYFGRWLPGVATAPLLLVSSMLLMHATRHRYRAGVVAAG